jgi:hypothetical protein
MPVGYEYGVTDLVIRAPSIAAMFDAWSPEPLDRRPLDNDVRERIVEEWTEHRRKADAKALVILLPATERREGLDRTVLGAIRGDLQRMIVDSRRHWFRRSLRGRKTRVGIALFFACLLISFLINYTADDALSTTLAQTFDVIAWVALWQPGQDVFDAAANRLARKHYEALSNIDMRVRWE